jgi:hypothetical protein
MPKVLLTKKSQWLIISKEAVIERIPVHQTGIYFLNKEPKAMYQELLRYNNS